ncbi:hypothetical protein P879_11906 [Paragonimus westermani]|uniref:Uncharacterized protein n=1 Tax=Paragonimus westermani TaxID=34504 RepID=A0A8T0D682_9TREM|nr:hypothetical protein P879_11906 [Paragonimus westermani]
MVGSSPRSQDFSLRRIIAQILNAREQHTTYILINGTDEVEPKPDTHFWFTLFQHAFLISESHDACVSGPRDDLLFFVNKKTTGSSKPKLMVMRKTSSKVPKADDISIDWEETVYLNLLMQYVSRLLSRSYLYTTLRDWRDFDCLSICVSNGTCYLCLLALFVFMFEHDG